MKSKETVTCKTCIFWRFKASSDGKAVGVCDNPKFPQKIRIGHTNEICEMLKEGVGLYEFEQAAQPYMTVRIPEEFGCIHHATAQD